MDENITGGQLVVRMLVSLGVRHVFGVPGGQTLAITDAILAEPSIEFVTVHHEGAAAVMADAYGRLTGTPGVCLATTGPGATNLLTGVGGALRDSSPCLVITCNNHAVNIHKDDAQNADHVAIFRSLTKWSRAVVTTNGIEQAIGEAYVQAMTGNPGPVLLDFARDAIEAATVPAATAQRPNSTHPLRAWVGERPTANAGAIQAAADAIASARRPVLWIGNGCQRSRAGAAVLALAEALHIPVLTTFNGIGTVPTNHPMVFGPLSRMGTNLASRVMGDADIVIAVGNSLNAVSTGRWTLRMPSIVQIDVDPTMIGRYYAGTTYGVVGDAASTVAQLHADLTTRPEAGTNATDRQSWLTSLRSHAEAWWQDDRPDEAAAAANGMAPADVVRVLRAAAPDDTLLIPDAGNPGVWSYLWEIRQAGSYIKPVGFGNMGFALPAAIAAATLDPERPILALIGDGSLGMTLAELETLARVGGRVAVVVLNDAGYGNIRQEQVLFYDNRTIGVDFGPVDYAMVARGLGIEAHQVSSLDQLRTDVAETLSGDHPTLFDVAIDPSISAWTYPAFAKYVPEEGLET